VKDEHRLGYETRPRQQNQRTSAADLITLSLCGTVVVAICVIGWAKIIRDIFL
jgi:hypothetical protein